MGLLRAFKYWRFQRKVKKVYKILPLINIYMQNMDYTRQQRRGFWREFVKNCNKSDQ